MLLLHLSLYVGDLKTIEVFELHPEDYRSPPPPPPMRISRKTSRRPIPLPPEPRSQNDQEKPQRRRIYCGNNVPSYHDLTEVQPQGPNDFSTFIKFATLDEARELVSNSGSSNDGSYLLIPVKFIGRIRNDPHLKPICGYFLKK